MAAGKDKSDDENNRTIAQNRKARHNYFIEDTIEAGIMLTGTEVKSLRTAQASIAESYAGEKAGEIFLFNAYIPEYGQSGKFFQHEARRPRKLLLHRREVKKLIGQIRQKSVTLVPLAMYFNRRGLVKVLLGLATGKKQHDKRDTIKERDWERQKARLMREK